MNRAVLLPLLALSSCTTMRVDDHSYHYNDTQPVNHVNVTYNVIKQEAPKPTVQEQDREYLQWSAKPTYNQEQEPYGYIRPVAFTPPYLSYPSRFRH